MTLATSLPRGLSVVTRSTGRSRLELMHSSARCPFRWPSRPGPRQDIAGKSHQRAFGYRVSVLAYGGPRPVHAAQGPQRGASALIDTEWSGHGRWVVPCGGCGTVAVTSPTVSSPKFTRVGELDEQRRKLRATRQTPSTAPPSSNAERRRVSASGCRTGSPSGSTPRASWSTSEDQWPAVRRRPGWRERHLPSRKDRESDAALGSERRPTAEKHVVGIIGGVWLDVSTLVSEPNGTSGSGPNSPSGEERTGRTVLRSFVCVTDVRTLLEVAATANAERHGATLELNLPAEQEARASAERRVSIDLREYSPQETLATLVSLAAFLEWVAEGAASARQVEAVNRVT